MNMTRNKISYKVIMELYADSHKRDKEIKHFPGLVSLKAEILRGLSAGCIGQNARWATG
jgi:hypothetical protein